jgi:hypothetical protein
MRHAAPEPRIRRTGPWQRWVLVLLMQALLALTLTAGQRAIAGPLHVHGDAHAGDHHQGAADAAGRHWHGDAADATGVVVLDGAAQAADDMTGGAAASALASGLPAFPRLPAVPSADRDAWAARGPALHWKDATPAPPEPPPRR